MSAWGIGRQSGAGSLAGGNTGLKPYVDRVVQWIPADVIALFMFGISVLKTQHPDPNPSLALLAGGLVVAPILVVLGARSRHRLDRKDGLLAVLSVPAFAIWSLAVPESGWHRIQWVAANPGWIVIITAAAALVFTGLAKIATDKM